MEKKLKIIIADNSAEFGQNCGKALREYGMDVVLCEKDGNVLVEKINFHKPDVVLADVFMPNRDILGVLEIIGKMNEKEKPLVLRQTVFSFYKSSASCTGTSFLFLGFPV